MIRALALLAALGALIGCGEGTPGPLLERAAEGPFEFRHRHGGVGNRELPETMGAGVALFDFDLDGDVDAYFSQSGDVRPSRPGAKRRPGRNALFANDGSGRFERVPGAEDPGYGQGVACGDVDGDGRDDLVSLNWGPNRAYLNEAGGFREATEELGLGLDDEWSLSGAFFDAEGDGDLDLYVVNYVVSEPGAHLRMGAPRGFPGYPHPDRFDGAADRFWVNEDGRFVERTVEAGLHRPSGKGLGVAPTDIDLDGLVDLYVANDSTPNFLFHNRGELRFEEVGLKLGVAYNEDGQTEAGMGVDSADPDGDGDLDLFVTNLDGETNTFYRNELRARGADGDVRERRLRFSDATSRSGLDAASRELVGFGTLFCDLDYDGRPDLLVANGHILDNAHVLSDTRTYAQPNQLLLGDGTGRFAPPPPELDVPAFAVPTVSRGLASADLNGDGALDFVVTTNDGVPELWFGRTAGARWLLLELDGPPGNPRGLGAAVWLELADGRRLLFRVESARSYASACQPVVSTGLPADVEAVEVLWPGGRRERWATGDARFEGRQVLVHGTGE